MEAEEEEGLFKADAANEEEEEMGVTVYSRRLFLSNASDRT
jgi:hypothetical protein